MIVENPKDVTKHRMRTDHLKTTEPVLLLHICHKSSETEMKKIAQLYNSSDDKYQKDAV